MLPAGSGGVGGVASVGGMAGGLYGQNMVMGSWCPPYDALQRPPAYGKITILFTFPIHLKIIIPSLFLYYLLIKLIIN